MSILPKAIYTFSEIPIKISPEFSKLEQTILKFVWNQKRPQIVKTILKKKTKSKRHHNPRPQAVLQSCNNQDSMVLAQKQALRKMEHNREPRNGPTHIWPTNL